MKKYLILAIFIPFLLAVSRNPRDARVPDGDVSIDPHTPITLDFRCVDPNGAYPANILTLTLEDAPVGCTVGEPNYSTVDNDLYAHFPINIPPLGVGTYEIMMGLWDSFDHNDFEVLTIRVEDITPPDIIGCGR